MDFRYSSGGFCAKNVEMGIFIAFIDSQKCFNPPYKTPGFFRLNPRMGAPLSPPMDANTIHIYNSFAKNVLNFYFK